MRLIAGLLAVLALAVVTAAAPALADTYTVNTTADADDAAPGDNSCATAAGKCSLRAAIREANAHPGSDVVNLPAGTFRLTVVGPGEELAATGDLDVTESLTVAGAGMDDTVLDGLTADRIFDLKNGVVFTARDLTIRGGSASAGGGLAQLTTGTTTLERVHFDANVAPSGGGLLNVAGPLTITDCVFERNLAMSGAGLLAVGTAPVTISGSTFSDNFTSGGDGAGMLIASSGTFSLTGSTVSGNTADGIAAGLLVSSPSSITIADTSFEGNSSNAQGGGLLAVGPGAITLTNVKVLGNFAPQIAGAIVSSSGGAISVSGSEFSDNFSLGTFSTAFQAIGNVTMTDVSARRNSCYSCMGGGLYVNTSGAFAATNLELTENLGAQGGGGAFLATGAMTLTGLNVRNNGGGLGGGLVAQAGGNLSISQSTFDGNAGAQGGGLYVVGSMAVTLSDSTVSNNRADFGPAAIGGAYVASMTNATVVNSTFTGNTAISAVGGLAIGGTSSASVRNATFVNNDAPAGSALYGLTPVTVVSTIVAGGANHCGPGVTSGGNNIDQGGSCAFAGSGDLTSDPQLGPLANNGGPTLTHLPAPTSPAIDAGAASGCPGADQRGQTRPSDGNADGTAVCDVGAVEFIDNCPNDPAKTLPGICGCGVADTDADQANGTADCLVNGELKARIGRAKTIVAALASDSDPAEAELGTIGTSFVPYVKAHTDIQVANPKPKLAKLAKKAAKAVKKVMKAKGSKLEKAKTKAGAALDTFNADVLPES